jgi:hypothetical protein
LRTIFLREKTVPNMSFASSSALSAWRTGATTPSGSLARDGGREVLPEEEVGRGSQRRLYMHSAMGGEYVVFQELVRAYHDGRKCRKSIQPC